MDYNSMKRREIQALCKKHNIPANSANSVLVEKLSKLLNEPEHEKPITRRLTFMKNPVETTDVGEPRQAKKVRFNPQNDLVEYQLRSGRKQMPVATKSKARRKSVAMKVDKSVDDNNSIDDGVQAPSRRAVQLTNVDKEPEGKLGRVTRLKVHTLTNGSAVQSDENKQSKKPVKDVKMASESVEETVVGRVRVTRSKAQTSIDDGTDPEVNPQVTKKRGIQVAKGVQNVEPSNELVDIPARVTRSRGQTVDDINNVVSNPQPEKKRTRKEMKATDMAPGNKQEFPKRKSLRTLGAEEINEDQGDEAEVPNVSSTTRSKAGMAVKSSGSNSKSKAANKNVVQQLEEPLKNSGWKDVKRRDVAPDDKQELPVRKSSRIRVVENMDEDDGNKVELAYGGRATRSKAHLAVKAPGRNSKTKSENKVVVQQLEQPSKHAGRKNVNRRKSVVPPENFKVVLHLDEPVNRPNRKARGKSVVRNTRGKVNNKAEMVRSSTAGKKQSKGKSVKVASDVEMKTANASGSPKSRKRSGTPVIEDQTIGTEYVSPADVSARRSTRSASKSEGKFVANNQLESCIKAHTSRIHNQLALKGALTEGNQRGTSQTLRSGTTTRGDSSNRRAKLSVPKQSDSEYHTVKSTKGGMPVSKLVNCEPDEEVVETEFTPVIDVSRRRLTRSAIRSDKNEVGSILGKTVREPNQTMHKKQRNEDVQLSSVKPAKFTLNPAVNIAPVPVTRSGIKHRGNASSNYSENVDKKKPARSVHKIEPLDAQISSPKVAVVGPSPDVDTIGVQSEVPTAATDGILGSLGNIQRPLSVAEVTETSSDAISEGSHVQNNVKSTMFSEVEAQVNSEKSVPNEIELTETGSMSKGLQTDVMLEESVVSIGKTDIMEDGSGALLGDAANKCDSSSYNIDSYAVYLESFEQSDVKGKLEEDDGHVEPSNIEGVDSWNEVADNGESDDVEDDIDAAHDSLAEQNELSTAGKLKEDEEHVEPSNIEGVDGGNEVADNDASDVVEDDTDAAHDNLAEQNDLSTARKLYEGHVEPSNIEGVDGGNEVADSGETDDVEDETDAAHDSLADQNDLSTAAKLKKDEGHVETCYTTGVCEPVEPSDSSTSIEVSPAPATSGNDVASVTVDALELETGLKPSNAYNTLEVHVAGNGADPEYAIDDQSDGQDGKSEHEQLTNNASPSTDRQYVGGDDLEPDHTETMPAATKVLITSSDQEPEPESNIAMDEETCCTAGVYDSVRPSDSSRSMEASPAPATSENDVASVTVDDLEESSRKIYKDAVSNIFGDIDGLGNTIEVTDTKNDSGIEQIIIGTSELTEGVWSKESASVSPDMRNELMIEEAKMTSTSDHGLDGGNFMDGCSNVGVGELDSQHVGNRTAHDTSTREEGLSILYTEECNLLGDVEVYENLITKESSQEEFSNSPASAKEDDRNKQDETPNPNTSADFDSYSCAMDEQKPVLANRSDVLDGSIKDDRVSDVATSARASSFIEERSTSAADLVDSVKNMDKTSRSVTDGKSNQEVDMMKENSNPDIIEEIFNWSDSSLKPLSTTPAASQINHVIDGHEGVVNFANQDHYSSLKFLYTTPAISLKEDTVNLTNQSHYSSLKSLFTTPATTTTSHVKGSEANTIGFAFSDNSYNEDIGINQMAAPEFNHQWENEPLEVFNGETGGNTTNSSENEIHGVLNIEDYANKFFDNEVDGSSDGSGKNKNCVFNDDLYDLPGEAAGTSHHEALDSKDNMINSGTFEKEETQLKWTKNGDDLASD